MAYEITCVKLKPVMST